MKIIINALSARVGGGQTYLTNLLQNLPEQWDVDILIYAPSSLHLPSDRRIRRGVMTWPPDNPLLRTMWEILALPQIIAREKAHVLFCPGGILSTRVPTGCKTVTMFRNMLPFDSAALSRVPYGLQKVRHLLLKPAMLRSMKEADLTIFISNYARRAIEPLTHVRNPVTIYHGIGDTFRTYAKKMHRPSWLPTGEYLLYVSRFDVYKHHFEVASAFASLPCDLVDRYKLLFVGELDNVLVQKVAELAHDRGLGDKIRFVGPIAHDELPAAYHHATVNLFASSCENCPNILLEALAAGRPVLSSDVMPMPEFGLEAVEYFSPTDPESIAGALVRVLRDGSRRIELAEAAAMRSVDFDWAKTARETWRQIIRLAV